MYLVGELGFKYVSQWEYEQDKEGNETQKGSYHYISFSSRNNFEVIDIKRYDYLISYYGNEEAVDESNKTKSIRTLYLDDTEVMIEYTNNILTIQKGSDVVYIDMKAYMQGLTDTYGSESTVLSSDILSIEESNGTMRVKVVFLNIAKKYNKEKTYFNFSSKIFFDL